MSVSTLMMRQQSHTAYEHMLGSILQHSSESDLCKALNADGFMDLESFVGLTAENLDLLRVPATDTDPEKPLHQSDKMLVLYFLKYMRHEASMGVAFDKAEDWTNLSSSAFGTFRIDLALNPITTSTSTSSTNTSAGNSTRPGYSPAAMFRKSIKRDQNLFPTLKDEKVNNNWHRSFEVQAGVQDVNDVLNPAYVPRTQEDKNLFAEKSLVAHWLPLMPW